MSAHSTAPHLKVGRRKKLNNLSQSKKVQDRKNHACHTMACFGELELYFYLIRIRIYQDLMQAALPARGLGGTKGA